MKYILDRPRPGLRPYGLSTAEEVLEVVAGNVRRMTASRGREADCHAVQANLDRVPVRFIARNHLIMIFCGLPQVLGDQVLLSGIRVTELPDSTLTNMYQWWNDVSPN